jgi:AraC-like DNA-binding protein
VYREYRPGGDTVDSVWTNTRHGVQRVVPDGCMDVMWINGELVVAGPDTEAFLARIEGTIYGVRFRPGVAPGFLGVPASELTNTRVPLTDLWTPDRVDRLRTNLHTGRPGEALLAAAQPAEPDTFAEVVLANIDTDIRDLAFRLGMSERQLHRRCLTKFGYGPKTLHRVLRFGRALNLAYDGTPFADIAYRTGYADQAHLSREVKTLAGTTLTEMVTSVA